MTMTADTFTISDTIHHPSGDLSMNPFPAGVDGTDSNTGPNGTLGTGSYYENENNLFHKNVNWTYTTTDSLGNTKHYGSYDNSKDLASFKPLGLSVILFLFSVYLFFVATKLYHQYFDKKFKEQIFNIIIYLCSASIIFSWLILVLSIKGVPISFWNWELMYFPNQFVLGVVLSSLLLLGIGIFRFTIIAFIHNPIDSENVTTDIRFSFVGFVFGILSLVANFWTIWSAFR